MKNQTLTETRFQIRKNRLLRQINKYRHALRTSEVGTFAEITAAQGFRKAKRAYRMFKAQYGTRFAY